LTLKTIPFYGFHFIVEQIKIAVYLVFRCAEFGDFQKVMASDYKLNPIPFRLIRKWLVDMSVTLAVLRKHGIVHRLYYLYL
jgi:hypothetical protein